MNDDNTHDDDDKKNVGLRVVADNDPENIARKRGDQEVERRAAALKSASTELAENMLRVMAGAGKDYELPGQIAAVLKLTMENENVGSYSNASPITIALQSWEKWDRGQESRFEQRWEDQAFDVVIRAALRVAAGRFNRSYASNSILSRAEHDLHMAMRHYREAQQENIAARDHEFRQREIDRQRRTTTERLYSLAPGRTELIDGGFLFDKARDPAGMAFAEQRLRDLKFEIEIAGNVVAYKRCNGDFTTLADPRHEKHIEFTVYPSAHFEPGYRQRKRRNSYGPTAPRFKLQDAWRKNLASKFDAMLAAACEKAAKQFSKSSSD